MKKRYKNIKIDQDELKPIGIGITENKKKNSIGSFIIIAIFVLIVVFLPQISSLINEYLNPQINTPVVPSDPTPEEPEEPNEDENYNDVFYELNETLKIEREDVSVSNFVVDNINNTISYNVTNMASGYANLEELGYFIEIYNMDKTFIGRVRLVDSRTLASNAFVSYTRNISADASQNIYYIILVKKTDVEYPDVTLVVNEANEGSIVCSNNYETVTYKFTDNALKSVSSVISYPLNVDNYEVIASEYQTLANTYNKTTGITSNFFQSTDGFNITTIVDLAEASRTMIFNADSFEEGTLPKVVSFEMNALGYTCQ